MAVCYAGMERLVDAYLKFMPPRDPLVSDREFELLQNIVPASYQFHDMMLGRLLQLAGDDVTVILVSPYGWRSGPARSRRQHGEPEDVESGRRPRGMIVARGAQIQSGLSIEQASVLDVAPTVLALFGLPIGSDMDGRLLQLAVGDEDVAAAEYINSWDLSDDGPGAHDAISDLNRPRIQAVIKELAELGYRDPQEEKLATEQQRVLRRNKFNLARSLIEAGEVDEAIAELRQLLAAPNTNVAAMTLLIEAYLIVGAHDDAQETVERLRAGGDRETLAEFFLGRIALCRGDGATALGLLRRVTDSSPNDPRAWLFLGRAHLALGEVAEARSSFERALALDPDNRDARDALLALSESAD
jgi:tetratricopeptide (TPR) repeat protein